MTPTIIKNFNRFAKTREKPRKSDLTWAQTCERCKTAILNLNRRFKPKPNQYPKEAVRAMVKSIQDIKNSNSEYAKLFWMLERINKAGYYKQARTTKQRSMWEMTYIRCREALRPRHTDPWLLAIRRFKYNRQHQHPRPP